MWRALAFPRWGASVRLQHAAESARPLSLAMGQCGERLRDPDLWGLVYRSGREQHTSSSQP